MKTCFAILLVTLATTLAASTTRKPLIRTGTATRNPPTRTGTTTSRKLFDCSNIEATEQTCSLEGIRTLFANKPNCGPKLKEMCLQKRDSKDTIPMECKRWFDGCNKCDVQEGTKTGCTRMFCIKMARAFCMVFVDGRECMISREDKLVCQKPGVTRPPVEKPTCDDITTDLDISAEDMCRKALYLCQDKPDIFQDCRTKMEEEEEETCKTVRDEPRRAKCCIENKLSGDHCKQFGGPDTLPEDCKTRCVVDGKFQEDVKECVRCRGKDEPDKTRVFDPLRVKDTIKEIAANLDNEDGGKCIKRIAQATAKLRARLVQWRKNEPGKEEKPEEETETNSLAEVATVLEETVETSGTVDDEFEDDEEGKVYREKAETNAERLRKKLGDEDKPKNCQPDFDALKDRFNDIVDKYSNLPAKLKAQGIKRVLLKFADMDIGSMDLKDAKSVCNFAKRFVGVLKKAETNHKARFAEARALVCTTAGKLLKDKLITRLSNCLHKAKRDAQDGDSAAKEDADADGQKFDNTIRKRVQNLIDVMKNKCLMKNTPDSKPEPVTDLFRVKLRARFKKKLDGELTEDDKKNIANKLNEAVQRKRPEARDIATTVEDGTTTAAPTNIGGRRRRALSPAVIVETTWSTSDAPSVADDVDLADVGVDFVGDSLDISAEPTTGSIEVTEPIGSIDDQLPELTQGSTQPADTTKKAADTTKKAADTGMMVIFGSASATLVAFCL